MKTEMILVPDLGSPEAVDVIDIVVAVGDEVQPEDTLIVVESEKATVEIPSPKAGRVTSLQVQVGQSIRTGDALLELEPVAPAQEEEAPTEEPAGEDIKEEEAKKEETPVAEPSEEAPEPNASHSAPQQVTEIAPQDTAIYAGPAVRRLAREMGVALAEVKGTGMKGRVTKEDLKAHVKQRLSQSVGPVALPEVDFSQFGEVSEEPLSKLRRTAAENLHRAWLTIPSVTHHDEADITSLEAFRQKRNAQGEEKLTLLAFLAKVVAQALHVFPRFNSALSTDGTTLVRKHYVHLGIAVDTEHGLMVPVVRDADKKGVRELAEEIRALAQRARERKLQPQEMQGGCFTISSLGGIGGGHFTPIINWPEVAILGVGRSKKQPHWNGEAFVPREMLPLSLSYDHRVIDGADAARFTRYLAHALEDMRHLLL